MEYTEKVPTRFGVVDFAVGRQKIKLSQDMELHGKHMPAGTIIGTHYECVRNSEGKGFVYTENMSYRPKLARDEIILTPDQFEVLQWHRRFEWDHWYEPRCSFCPKWQKDLDDRGEYPECGKKPSGNMMHEDRIMWAVMITALVGICLCGMLGLLGCV